jgi:TatD DNase family protein
VLREEGAPERVVFHCFSGDEGLARICNDAGWNMSFAGTVTFRNAADLRAALAVADPDLVLVETDAPFLTPHPHRGRPNASYMVPYTVRAMAELTGTDLAELCGRISANTLRAYGEWA